MMILKQRRIRRSLVAVGISVSVLCSGSALLNAQPAYADTYNSNNLFGSFFGYDSGSYDYSSPAPNRDSSSRVSEDFYRSPVQDRDYSSRPSDDLDRSPAPNRDSGSRTSDDSDRSSEKTVTVTSNSSASGIIATGKTFLGVPYKFGAKSGDTSKFDCSSFTQYVFGKHGIDLPRSSKAQSKVGTPVSRDNLQPGDLVFFYSPVHHVGIYIGNGQILHTYGEPGVTVSSLNSGWWDEHYQSARRVL